MDVRRNDKYIITDSIHIGETEFVIGAHEKDPSRFVTWACKNGNDYFWGHYLTSREAGSVGGQMVKKMIESYEKNL